MGTGDDALADRLLVLAPTGSDAPILCERLGGDGIACCVCADVGALVAAISVGAGAVLVAKEALVDGGAEALLAALDAQESWSDLPVLLLTLPTSMRRPARVATIMRVLEGANVTLLQRPIEPRLLVSTVRSAIRARRRQYQMRHLLQQLQRAIQLSDLFVSILGHDLRTPLSAIRLSAESIVRLPDGRALRPAGRILSATDRMTRMIEQILDFARVRQGQGIPLARRRVHLGDICRSVVQEVEDANPHALIEVREAGGLDGEWDGDRLAQMVANLLGNAAQHGASGRPIELELDGRDHGEVRIRVHNEGSVPAVALPTLFEAFKGSASRAGRTGLGLGLFIARAIARAHGGEIAVRSSDDEGTTFEATLPRRPAAPDEPDVRSGEPAPSGGP